MNIDKIKILYNKKPIPASKKSLADALDGGQQQTDKDLDLAVMVMGGAPDPPSEPPKMPVSTTGTSTMDDEKMEDVETQTGTAVQPGEVSGKAVLEQPGFWDDLQGFLEQRIKDETEAKKLRDVFERAWRSGSSAP